MSDARYEVSFIVGPDSEKRVIALSEAIVDLPEFAAVGGGAVGMEKLVCACTTAADRMAGALELIVRMTRVADPEVHEIAKAALWPEGSS